MDVKVVEPVGLAARARHHAEALARHAYHAPGRAAFRRQLERLPAPARGPVQLSFGWLEPPRRADEARIGGAVKLGHLRERFGESRAGFNVLYLVSSTIHLVPHVETLVAWARASGVRIVWNQNGVAYPAWCGDRYPWFNAPMRRLLHAADYVVYQSAFCRACADRYLDAVAAPHTVLWNPVNLAPFSPGEALPPRPWRLLAMGTNHAFYRVRSTLDTLAELRRRGHDAHLVIAGELRWPNADAEVAAHVARLGIAGFVQLRGRFTQDEAPALYRAAHVLLHPKYNDPCPTVPIEALACGVPVVGSASGGMPELVTPACGRLVPVAVDWTRDITPDAGAMAEAVESLMANHPAFAEAARQRARESFDRDAWLDRHAKIFASLLS